MNYCSGWMRQQENQQLGIPVDVARGFPERLRKLCGFGLYRGLIGHIDKCSPADLLDGSGLRLSWASWAAQRTRASRRHEERC